MNKITGDPEVDTTIQAWLRLRGLKFSDVDEIQVTEDNMTMEKRISIKLQPSARYITIELESGAGHE